MTVTIQANNAFYYYQDLDAATDFYVTHLGFPVVADFGFARMIQVASSSFLTLVDVTRGLHHGDEPKTVTTAFITDELEAWAVYLTGLNVPMHRTFAPQARSAHDGFVVLDPEGYLLEFERFNPHPENDTLIPQLDGLPSLYPSPDQATSRPVNLGVKATVTWLYYEDMGVAQQWWEDACGLSRLVDQGFAFIYQTSRSGFVGPVRAGQGLHPFAAEKLVTVSFLTDTLEDWFARLSARTDFPLRTAAISQEGEDVALFVGYDTANYLVEFDQVQPSVRTADLARILSQTPPHQLEVAYVPA